MSLINIKETLKKQEIKKVKIQTSSNQYLTFFGFPELSLYPHDRSIQPFLLLHYAKHGYNQDNNQEDKEVLYEK